MEILTDTQFKLIPVFIMLHKMILTALGFVWLVVVPLQLANFANSDNDSNQIENDLDVIRYECNPRFKSCLVPF